MKSRKVLFKIDRAAPQSLVEQLAFGIRNAVESGLYIAGDVLPTRIELARMFKVSEKVSREAVALLVREGYLRTRKGIGAIVVSRGRPPWHGNVLFVKGGDGGVYANNVQEGAFRERMMAEGYLVTTVTASSPKLKMTWLQLETVLRQKFDLAVYGGASPRPIGMIARAGIPLLASGEGAAGSVNCVGKVVCGRDAAMRDFARWCCGNAIRSVEQVSFGRQYCDASGALSEAGITVRGIHVVPDWKTGTVGPECVQRAALDMFARRIQRGRVRFPDLYFFTDDYLCAGAVTAMLCNGVKVPGDVRVASIANAGLGPVLPFPFPRISFDWRGYGSALAGGALSYLRTGVVSESAVAGAQAEFIAPGDADRSDAGRCRSRRRG